MIQLMEHFQRSCNSIGFFELIYDISVRKSSTYILFVYALVDIESSFFTIFLFYFLFVNWRRKFIFLRIFFGLRFPYNLSSELTQELLEIDST